MITIDIFFPIGAKLLNTHVQYTKDFYTTISRVWLRSNSWLSFSFPIIRIDLPLDEMKETIYSNTQSNSSNYPLKGKYLSSRSRHLIQLAIHQLRETSRPHILPTRLFERIGLSKFFLRVGLKPAVLRVLRWAWLTCGTRQRVWDHPLHPLVFQRVRHMIYFVWYSTPTSPDRHLLASNEVSWPFIFRGFALLCQLDGHDR